MNNLCMMQNLSVWRRIEVVDGERFLIENTLVKGVCVSWWSFCIKKAKKIISLTFSFQLTPCAYMYHPLPPMDTSLPLSPSEL